MSNQIADLAEVKNETWLIFCVSPHELLPTLSDLISSSLTRIFRNLMTVVLKPLYLVPVKLDSSWNRPRVLAVIYSIRLYYTPLT